MRVNWTRTGFSLNVITEGTPVPVCYGYLPSANNQQMYTAIIPITSKSHVRQEVVEVLRGAALETGLFQPAGKGIELSCRTDMPLEESQLNALIDWLTNTVSSASEYEGTSGGKAKRKAEDILPPPKGTPSATDAESSATSTFKEPSTGSRWVATKGGGTLSGKDRGQGYNQAVPAP